jgi:hypothetical protein
MGTVIQLKNADFSANNLGQIFIGNDPDAQAYADSIGLVNANTILHFNFFVRYLKNNGIWGDITSIFPMYGSTSTNHLVNLKNSSAPATLIGSGGVFTNNGFETKGTSYFDSSEDIKNNRTILMAKNTLFLNQNDNYAMGNLSGNQNGGGLYFSSTFRNVLASSAASVNALLGSTSAVGSSIIAGSFKSGLQTLIDNGGTYSATATYTEGQTAFKLSIGAAWQGAYRISNMIVKTTIVANYLTPDKLLILRNAVSTLETNLAR